MAPETIIPCPARITARFASCISLRGLGIIAFGGREVGTIAGQLGLRRLPIELTRGLLRVFGDVHQHGAGRAGCGHIKGFTERARQLARMRHQIVVLVMGRVTPVISVS